MLLVGSAELIHVRVPDSVRDFLYGTLFKAKKICAVHPNRGEICVRCGVSVAFKQLSQIYLADITMPSDA